MKTKKNKITDNQVAVSSYSLLKYSWTMELHTISPNTLIVGFTNPNLQHFNAKNLILILNYSIDSKL